MNGLARYMAGSVRFEVKGGRGERFFNECINADIPIEQIKPTDTGYCARVPLRDYKRLRPFARRNRCGLRVREKYGLYFALAVYRGRWGILLGMILCALVLFSCGNLIWNICFIDFTPAQEASVRKQLFEMGIYEGAFQDNARLMRAASELFIDSEEYGWITLNFVKGRLVIEKTRREKPPEMSETELTNIIASCDGIVRHVELESGYSRVTDGQYVTRGQLLVSGMRLSSYERPLYSRAEAVVTAEVQNTYVYKQPLHGETTLPTAEYKSYYTLYLPWISVPLYRRIDVPEGASQRVLRKPAAPLGFHLPMTIEEVQVRTVRPTAWELTEEQAAEVARSRILDMLRTEFGRYEILEETPETELTGDTLTLSLRVRFLADIAEQVPYTQPAQNDESTQTEV